MNTSAISARAMLANLSISAWSARKLDKSATAAVTHDAGATSDAARVNKHLLAGQDATLKAVGTIASAARADFYALTLPWSNDGPRILSAALWADLNRKLAAHAAAYQDAVNAFLDDYAQSRTRAQFALGSLFKESDYPSVSNVAAKFAFSYSFDPLPTAADFRVNLADDEADMIRRDIEQRAADRYSNAMRDVWTRLYETVEKIATTLPAYDNGEVKRFNDTLTGNLADLLAILPGLNLTNDPQLTALADRAAAELGNFAPQTLRDNPDARHKATTAAAAICRTMAAHLGNPAPILPAAPEPFTTPTPAPVFDLFAPAIRAA